MAKVRQGSRGFESEDLCRHADRHAGKIPGWMKRLQVVALGILRYGWRVSGEGGAGQRLRKNRPSRRRWQGAANKRVRRMKMSDKRTGCSSRAKETGDDGGGEEEKG